MIRPSVLYIVFFFLTFPFVSTAYSYLPIIKSYDKKDYNAGRQNWDVGTDSYGIVYFGNNDGLLRNVYGQWQLSKTTREDVVRSLCVDNDTVWCGGGLEYGFFVKDSPGNMSYTKLGEVQGGQIWEVKVYKGVVYFQSEGSIYAYDKKSGEISIISDESGFYGMQVWQNKLWAISRSGVLGLVKGKEFIALYTIQKNFDSEVRKMFVHENRLLIILFDGKIYEYTGETLIEIELKDTEKKYSFFSAYSLNSDHFLIGTISNGLLQVDGSRQRIMKSFGKDDGLNDNTVLGIGTDLDGNIWLGLDYGIAYIEVQNPVKPIFEQGATYFIKDFENSTYLATNKGMFQSSGNNPFTMDEGTSGQVWRLRKIEDELWVCHNRGLYKLNGQQLEPLFTDEGVMDVEVFPGTDLCLLSAYSGLLLAKRSQGGFKLLENLNLWGNPKLSYDSKSGYLWADAKWGQLWGLTLDASQKVTQKEFPEITTYFESEGQFVFYDGDKLRSYNNQSFTVVSEAPFNLIEGPGVVALDFDANANLIAYVQEGVPHLMVSHFDGNFYSYKKILSSLKGRLLENDEFIGIEDGELRIATDRGAVAFSIDSNTKYSKIVKSVVSKIEVFEDGSKRNEYSYPYMEDQLEFSPGEKNIVFHFGVNKTTSDLAEFRYRLWPYDKDWSEWSSTVFKKEYTQLKGGSYKLSLQCRLNGGQVKEQAVLFDIEKFWFQTSWVFLPVILFFIAVIILSVRFMNRINDYRMAKEKEKHRQKVMHKTLEMKNEQLLQYMEVISNKNEFLLELKGKLERMRNSDARQLEQKILDEVNSEKKDFLFHKLFSELHQDFIQRIKEKYPQLTSNDIRMISFIRLNIDSGKIANLMNISPKSVDVSRYRIRKKLDIPGDVDLNQFILEV
jgi:AraC family chitin signaling transcriptional activator